MRMAVEHHLFVFGQDIVGIAHEGNLDLRTDEDQTWHTF